MFPTSIPTPFRKRQRRHARLPVAASRDPRPVRYVVLPTPAMRHAVAAPDAPWPGRDDRVAELEAATWEDAEWQ